MSPSEEVNDERDPIQLLVSKRQDLARTEEKLQVARAALDVDGEVLARQRIAVLRDQLTRLEAAAVGALDRRGAQEGQAWLAGHDRRLGGVGERITAVQTRALALVAQLVAVIGEEASLRHAVEEEQARELVLRLRWPSAELLRQKPLRLEPAETTLPTHADYERPILQAVQDMLPRRGLRIMEAVPVGASDPPDVVRKSIFRALATFLEGPANRKALGDEVLGIIERAGIPAWETPEQKTQREAREAKRRGEAAVIGGSMSGAAN